MTQSIKRITYLILIAFVIMYATMVQANDGPDWEEGGTTLVGRVTHLEGNLSRYDADQKEWVATSRDAPVGRNDQLYTDVDSKAELILPNNAWVRLAGDTDIQLPALDDNYTELEISLGKARLYNKSSTAEIKAATPFGHIMTPPGASVDIDVYSDGVDIVAIHQAVYFVHQRSGTQHEIKAGAGSLFAGTQQVSAGRGDVATAWNQWNKEMDALWAMRSRTRGESATYLPPVLHYDAYALDTHGCWERVYYQGAYYRFWRPVHVHAGWTPFSSGVWHVWWGDHVWIPHEPFGYVTHHYGNWVFAAGYWYWAPPVTRVSIRIGLPLLPIGFGWYPGRVAWIHAGVHVGWFPLGPYEPYYSHRRWGRRSVVVAKGTRQRYRPHHYKHRSHAVVVHQKDLYRSKNYRDTRIRNIPAAEFDRKFRTSGVPRSRVSKNYRTAPGKKTIRPNLEPRKSRWVRNPNSRQSQKAVNTSTRLRQAGTLVDSKTVSRATKKHSKRTIQANPPRPEIRQAPIRNKKNTKERPQNDRRLAPDPSQRSKQTDRSRRAKNIRAQTDTEEPARNEGLDKRLQNQPPKEDYRPEVMRAQKTQVPEKTRYQRGNESGSSNRQLQTAFNPLASSQKRPDRKPSQGHQVRARQDVTSSGWKGRSSGPEGYRQRGSRQRR